MSLVPLSPVDGTTRLHGACTSGPDPGTGLEAAGVPSEEEEVAQEGHLPDATSQHQTGAAAAVQK